MELFSEISVEISITQKKVSSIESLYKALLAHHIDTSAASCRAVVSRQPQRDSNVRRRFKAIIWAFFVNGCFGHRHRFNSQTV